MSKTDKTRPWWVQAVDACVPVHDHRFGPCTLPGRASATRTDPDGCYWGGTTYFWCRRCESHGYREWNFFRRAERRRSRRQARRDLHGYLGDG